MSQSQSPGAAGRGVMRFLAGGAGSARFAAVFQFAEAIFSSEKQAAWAEREQQRRRKLPVPAPGDLPRETAPEDATVAVPLSFLSGEVSDVAVDVDQPLREEHDPPAADPG